MRSIHEYHNKNKKVMSKLPTTISLCLMLCFSSHILPENRQSDINSLLKEIATAQDTQKVNMLNELSKQYYKMDIYDSAIEYATQANALAEQLKYKKGIAISLNRMGTINSEQCNYPKSLELYFQALKVSEQTKDAYCVFTAQIGIGTVYYYQGDYTQALNYLFKAEKINQNKGLVYISIGRVYIEQENYSMALNYFEKSFNYYYSIKDKIGISKSLNNIGCVYEYQNNYQNALNNYNEALKLFQEIEDKQGECDALASIGDVYFAQGKYTDAIFAENKSLAIANQIGYLSSAVQTEKVLSEIYNEMNETYESYNHYKKYIALKDSLFNEENTKKTVRAEMNYNFDKKQTEEKLVQDRKDAVNRTILYSVICGTFVFCLLSLFLFKEYKAKKNAHKIIAEKQEEVLASIRYAKRIQQALMPTEKQINKTLNRLKC